MSSIKRIASDNSNPESRMLSVGSHYFQSSAHPVNMQYIYFNHFNPFINSTRQTAFHCFLDAELSIKVASDIMKVLSYPRQSLANLSLLDRRNLVYLFEEGMHGFVAFNHYGDTKTIVLACSAL